MRPSETQASAPGTRPQVSEVHGIASAATAVDKVLSTDRELYLFLAPGQPQSPPSNFGGTTPTLTHMTSAVTERHTGGPEADHQGHRQDHQFVPPGLAMETI